MCPSPSLAPETNTATITGTLSAANVIALPAQEIDSGAAGFAEMLKAIRAAAAYVNLHTANHPSGEIRARLGHRGFGHKKSVELRGVSQDVPPQVSSSYNHPNEWKGRRSLTRTFTQDELRGQYAVAYKPADDRAGRSFASRKPAAEISGCTASARGASARNSAPQALSFPAPLPAPCVTDAAKCVTLAKSGYFGAEP